MRIQQSSSSPIDDQASKAITLKTKWDDKEIERLHEGVRLHGKNWTKVMEVVGTRLSKQCRNRWVNYEDPARIKASWTKEENQILIEQFQKLGSKWSLITPFLPGRSQNDIKNHWNGKLKSIVEKMDSDKMHSSFKKHKMKNIRPKPAPQTVYLPPSSDSLLKEEPPKGVKEQDQALLAAEALDLPETFSPVKTELDVSDFEFNNTDFPDFLEDSTPIDLFSATFDSQNSNPDMNRNQLLQSPLTPKTPTWNPKEIAKKIVWHLKVNFENFLT